MQQPIVGFTDSGGDSALRPLCVGVADLCLRQNANSTKLGDRQGKTQTRKAAADNQEVVLFSHCHDTFLRRHLHGFDREIGFYDRKIESKLSIQVDGDNRISHFFTLPSVP